MRFMIINFFLCYWLVSCFGLAYAGRPLATDDAGVVDKGHFEMEAGLEYANQTDKEVGLSLVIKRGMLDNLDLGIEIPYTFIDFAEGATSDGFGDINLSAKLNLLKEQDNLPAMAVSFQLKTDSGNDDKSLGTGKREYAVNYIASKSIAVIARNLAALSIPSWPSGDAAASRNSAVCPTMSSDPIEI